MSGRILTVLLALLLGGCSWITDYLSGEDNSTPPTPLTDIQSHLKVERVWSASVGGVDEDSPAKLAPALCEGRLFAAGGSGRLQAFDATDGKTLWEADGKTHLSGGVGCGAELVLVGTDQGRVLAYHAADGTPAWQVTVSSEVLAPPRADAGVVVVRTIDGKVFGLDAQDGKRLWIYDRSTPVLTLRGTASMVLAHGAAIGGFDNGKLAALTLADGKPIWEASIAVPRGRSELERMVDIDSDPQIQGDHLYVATYQGRLAALTLAEGRIEWVRDMSSYAGIGVDDRYIYLTDDQGQVWQLAQDGGAALWKQDKLIGRNVTAPVVFGDSVVVGDFEGYLHWLSVDDGDFLAHERVDSSGIDVAPIVGDDLLYVQSKGGTLAAYRIQ